MNLKMGADDIDRLGAANLQDQQAKGETSAVEESSSEQSGESDWIRVRMLEEAEMNGMRFFEGIVVDVRKEDATKLVESGQAQIVAEQPEDKPDEPTAEAATVEAEAEATAEVEVEVEDEATAPAEVEATAEGEATPDAPDTQEDVDLGATESEATEITSENATEEAPADALKTPRRIACRKWPRQKMKLMQGMHLMLVRLVMMKKAPMINPEAIQPLPARAGRGIMTAGLLSGLALLTACDDFTRFRNEQYLCPQNAYGINEMIINSAKVGDTARLLTTDGEISLTITEKSKSTLNLKGPAYFISADRNTGTLKVIEKNRFRQLRCEVKIFTM